ncbi:MAG: glycoside hydrolase [candidate division Zixibacteria bacterium]|nr:glycoside hydrolase [candidate division Zixibacteria bacterium]MDH3938295.1 glycoside hydrolase [candidate division Zixibacteria bacterium]
MTKLCSLLFVTFLISSSASHADPVPVPTQITISNWWDVQNEEQIWVSPTAPDILVACWRDFRQGYRQVGIGRSNDGGLNWTGDTLINPANQIFDWQSDPTLTVDANGTFYLCVVDYQDYWGYDSCFLAWHVSNDSGVSWSGPHTVKDTIGPFFEDKQFTAVDRTGGSHSGNIYVAWKRFYDGGPEGQIMFARSTAGAVTWDDTLVIGPRRDASACGWPDIGAGQFAFPLVGSDGSVYVFWAGTYLDGAPTCTIGYGLDFVKSTNGGASFTSPTPIRRTYGNWGSVDGGIDVYNAPTAAADISGGPFDGNIYIAYANLDTSNTEFIDSDYNIEFIRSLDGGASWSTPIYINDDYTGDSATVDQFHPWLSCDELDGTLAAIWYDQRIDENSHFWFMVFAAYSFDGGVTFTTNHRISENWIDPDLADPPPYTVGGTGNVLNTPMTKSRAGKLAEYIGLSISSKQAHAVWTGTGPEEPFGLTTGQNVYGASWEIPFLPPRLISPPGGSSPKARANSVTFTWSTCWDSESDFYRIEIADNPSFVQLLVDNETDDNSITLPKSLFAIDVQHHWRVKAFRQDPNLPYDSTDYSEGTFTIGSGCCVLRGDVDHSGGLDISDLVYLVDFMFSGGPEPLCFDEADIDSSGAEPVDIADLVFLVDFMFNQGPAPGACP